MELGVGGNARSGQLAAIAGHQRPAVAPGALPCFGVPEFAACGRAKQAEQRLSGTDQRDRDGPAFAAVDEIAGAINRVDQPDQPACQPIGTVGGFFG